MACGDVRRLVEAWRDSMADTRDRDEVARHAAGCGPCRRLLAAEDGLAAALAAARRIVATAPPPPPGFREGLRRRLAGRTAARAGGLGAGGRWGLAAAAVLLVAAVVVTVTPWFSSEEERRLAARRDAGAATPVTDFTAAWPPDTRLVWGSDAMEIVAPSATLVSHAAGSGASPAATGQAVDLVEWDF